MQSGFGNLHVLRGGTFLENSFWSNGASKFARLPAAWWGEISHAWRGGVSSVRTGVLEDGKRALKRLRGRSSGVLQSRLFAASVGAEVFLGRVGDRSSPKPWAWTIAGYPSSPQRWGMAQLSWEILEHPRGDRVREAGGEFGRKSGRKTEVLRNLGGGKALDAICMGLFGGRGTVSVGEGWTGHRGGVELYTPILSGLRCSLAWEGSQHPCKRLGAPPVNISCT